MEWLKLLWQATKAGKQLENSDIWKSRQDLGNVFLTFATILAAVLSHKGILLEPEDIQNIAGISVTIGMLWNKYLISATSKSVGIGTVSATPSEKGELPAIRKPSDNLSSQPDKPFNPIE